MLKDDYLIFATLRAHVVTSKKAIGGNDFFGHLVVGEVGYDNLVVVVVVCCSQIIIHYLVAIEEVWICIRCHVVYNGFTANLCCLRCWNPVICQCHRLSLGIIEPVGEVVVERIMVVVWYKNSATELEASAATPIEDRSFDVEISLTDYYANKCGTDTWNVTVERTFHSEAEARFCS